MSSESAAIMTPTIGVEGEIPFAATGTSKPSKTWYKVIGKLESPPLIVLHGGPGTAHEYMTPLQEIYQRCNIPVIFYDQIGCGRSTRFPEERPGSSFWTFDLFLKELANLIDHFNLHQLGFYIIGQSWGGMLGAAYACTRPKGLRKMILASAPASIPEFAKGSRELLAEMPADIRQVIEECEHDKDFDSPKYHAACSEFYGRYFCRLSPMPELLQTGFKHLGEDCSAYQTLQGPSEFTIIGTFKNWEGWREAHQVEADVLILNGRYDEVRDAAIEPWFWALPRVRWVTFEKSAHMPHIEEPERFMDLCASFLGK
ncbi:proline iminopeptidase [Xylariaceae sp. FL0255]|nr:proline iminopeptidase [Xylariaceae sp. FL0255]